MAEEWCFFISVGPFFQWSLYFYSNPLILQWFLQQKLQESKENKYMTEKIEYVIDSIKNGTGRSNKYKFY